MHRELAVGTGSGSMSYQLRAYNSISSVVLTRGLRSDHHSRRAATQSVAAASAAGLYVRLM